MDENRKSEKNGKSKSDHATPEAEQSSDAGGLAASLDALMKIAEKGKQRDEGEVVRLPTGKGKERDGSAGSAKELVDELDEKYSNNSDSLGRKSLKSPRDHGEDKPEQPGVVELLSALKSDIDSLRKDNEEFKNQLMGRKPARSSSNNDSSDVRDLLEALKADIGDLRHETDDLRTQAFSNRYVAAKPKETAAEGGDQDLYLMLAELKDDIVSLRSENDALRHGTMGSKPVPQIEKRDEVAMMLQELKADINDLKHENESLRIENLTARDGARFENLGGQPEAYRNTQNSSFSGVLKGLGALILVAGAAGGGYYLAKTQGGGVDTGPHQPVIASKPAIILREPVIVKPTAPVKKSAGSVKRVEAPETAKKPPEPKVKTAPVKKAAGPSLRISSDVETAMMARAEGLLEARDLGAARMVFVYLARHGSGGAMNRLAQTYDPQYLEAHRFDAAKNGDFTRAIRLYDAASNMGDASATRRLQELQ